MRLVGCRRTDIVYHYSGLCPRSGQILSLPRTLEIEQIAHDLMATLAEDCSDHQDGKMYGVLLVENPAGQRQVLKAFSGLLHQQATVDGWVPPIPGREQVAFAEAPTLVQLTQIRNHLLDLNQTLQHVSQLYEQRSQSYDTPWQALTQTHSERKQDRDQQRQQALNTLSGENLSGVLRQLEEASRRDGRERRNFKFDRNTALNPLRDQQIQIQTQIQTLKQQRKTLSRQLQTQLHHSYWLSNFAGESVLLHDVYGDGMPTGTGECCAPKLLHYAATHNLKPLAMAEFWWGAPQRDKIPGQFYGACAERCQPLMGFLLSGLSSPLPNVRLPKLPLLYEDAWIVAVDKPGGLLSVPGRDRQNNVLWQLQDQMGLLLWAVHRLDQETSGVLLLAKDRVTYRQLSQQFQSRHVEKYYEALLAGQIQPAFGVIDLPLWGDPGNRPRQSVNWETGKPSQTRFGLLDQQRDHAHVIFQPITGRTHQLRVHAADPLGLGVPILGDRLYGDPKVEDRLHLHATILKIRHPQTGEILDVRSPWIK